MVRQEVSPLVERPVAGDGQTPALVGGGNEPKEKLGAGVVERGKAEFVDDDEVSPQQLVDDSSHGVVGQAAVEGLDEVSGDEVASPQSSCDRGKAESQEQMGLPRSGRPDQAEVLPGAHPLQAGQIVEGGPGDGGESQVEPFQGLAHGKGGFFQPTGSVGLVPGSDLGLYQGPQQLLGGPSLGYGR